MGEGAGGLCGRASDQHVDGTVGREHLAGPGAADDSGQPLRVERRVQHRTRLAAVASKFGVLVRLLDRSKKRA